MRGFTAILARELFGLFVTPLAWILGAAFSLLQGLHFYLVLSHFATGGGAAGVGPVETFFGQTILLYLPLFFVCPLLTMRLFAEERRSGTIELLLTAPVDPAAVVLGKYLAVLTTYAALWLPTVGYFVLLGRFGAIDPWVVGSSYVAVLGVGAGCLALGTLTSALVRSQLAAAVLSALCVLGLFMFGLGEFVFPEGAAQEVASYVSVWGQMNDFSRGIVDSRRLLLDATLVVLPLFVTTRAVAAWRFE